MSIPAAVRWNKETWERRSADEQGSKLTTMQQVARRAGVSAKTVSRVFNDEPHVLPATRERVQAAIAELNYVPNMLARSFREGKDAVLAVAVPDIADPFFAPLIRSIESVAERRGVAVIVTALGRDPGRESAIVETLLRRQVLGLIICPVIEDQSYLRRWQERTPIAFVDRAPANLRADTFLEDDRAGGYQATRHLAAFGHHRIAFLGDTIELYTTRLRYAGYAAALADAGLPEHSEVVSFGSVSDEDAGRSVSALLAGAAPPTAIFSSNERFSMGVIPMLHALGRTDVALVGFGDVPLAGVIKPGLTVIDQDPDRLGAAAAERIFIRLDHPARRLPRRVILPLRLIARGSGELPGPDCPRREAGRPETAGPDTRRPSALLLTHT
jgi:LacI family transcriptional regulator